LDVCWGPSCHISGSQKLIGQAHTRLDVEGEGETKDGKVTLRYSTCLGACAQSPVFAVNHKMHGKMTENKVDQLINKLTR
jgi:NADH:ubiquinone oxidoreductase subunit E